MKEDKAKAIVENTKEKELRSAYDAGLSKLNHGANNENCNFRHFSSRQKMKAWEAGARGEPFNIKNILISAL